MQFFKNTNRLKTITALCLIILIIEQHHVNCLFAALTTFSTMVQLGYSIYGVLNDAHDTYNKFATASTQDVMDKVVEIADNLNRIGTQLEKKIDNALETLLRRLPLQNRIDDNLQELNLYIVRIDSLYNDFEAYARNPDDFDDIEIENIIDAAISRRPGDIRDVTDKMHSLIVPGRLGTLKKSLLVLLAEDTLEYALDLCDTGAPPQQRIFELYSMVVLTELRSFAITGFSFVEQSKAQNMNFTRSLKYLQDKNELRTKQYILALKNALTIAAKKFRRCELATGQVRDETFYEFVRFMQAFIVQEQALVDDHGCAVDCGGFGNTKIYTGCDGYECHGSPTTCYGRLDWCSSWGVGTVCQNPPSNPRRYQFLNWEGDHDTECKGHLTQTVTTTPIDFWNKCDVCKCACIEEDVRSKSSHFVNLRPVESDIDNDMIVSGLRFVMENKILSIQIQEGKLEENATVPGETSEWKKIENIEYQEETSVARNKFIFTIDSGSELGDDEIAVLKQWQRRFYLDDLIAPEDYVVTGIKFSQLPYEKHTARPIYLEIRVTKIDYIKGELIDKENSYWMSYKDTRYWKNDEYREEIDNSNKGSPLKKNKLDINSSPNQSIDLASTSYYGDAGQTIIPLLDALPIYGNPLTPLAGVGLYHKAANSGGFLTFVIEGLDRARYINIDG